VVDGELIFHLLRLWLFMVN